MENPTFQFLLKPPSLGLKKGEAQLFLEWNNPLKRNPSLSAVILSSRADGLKLGFALQLEASANISRRQKIPFNKLLKIQWTLFL